MHIYTTKYNKYSNKKTTIDNITFDSRKEAKRYQELKLLEKTGRIQSLVLQPRFLLQDKFRYKNKGYRKIEYVADFSYYHSINDCLIIEDVKGVKTDVFRLKEKMLIYSLMMQSKNFEFRII